MWQHRLPSNMPGPPAMAATSSAGAARQRMRRRLSSTADSASLHKGRAQVVRAFQEVNVQGSVSCMLASHSHACTGSMCLFGAAGSALAHTRKLD